MTQQLTLSKTAARKLHLAAQGLLHAPKKTAQAADVLQAIRNMGVLQIDTISVVARSPYLVLWSRLGQYENNWLEQLLEQRKLFEYWAHEACFVPIEDYPYYRHRMLDPASMGWKSSANWHAQNRPQVEQVLSHIRQHGATRSRDFERTDGKGGGWWEWKPEKRALEVLFTAGELMIEKRENFHRVYNLAERILPDWDDARLPSRAEVDLVLVQKAVQAIGICKASWIGDYFRTSKSKPRVDPAQLVEQGLLHQVQVEGFEQAFYVHPAHFALAQQAEQLQAKHTCLLSPFDPVVWDRKRALELFDFDYRIECYTPQAKRQYGYFCLPILRKGGLIGRLDAKAHRKEGVFAINALYLEDGVRVSQSLAQDVATSVLACAAWHACPQVTLKHCANPVLAEMLQALFIRGTA